MVASVVEHHRHHRLRDAYDVLLELDAIGKLLAGAVPVAAISIAVVVGRRDGLGLDVWLWHAVRGLRAAKRQAPAAAADAAVDRLRLPADSVDHDGTLQLSGGGHAVIVAVSTVGFFLRDPGEQDTIVDGFARWCQGLSGHAQITVSTRPVDLSTPAEGIETAADRLPHPALADAALGYADFLRRLALDQDPLTRQVLITHTGPDRKTVRRAAWHTARTLAALGVATSVLDAPTVTDVLYAAADPWHPAAYGHALPDAVITGPPSPATREHR